jgi:hypothetical protein
MKKLNAKTRTTAIALFLLIITLAGSTIFALTTLQTANAHTPPWTIPIHIYLIASPNPIALGQQTTLFYWVDIAPPTSGPSTGYRWQNITIDVTKPDGHNDHFGPLTAGLAASGNIAYTPDQTGTYNITVNFPSQVLTQGGNTASTSVYINDTYSASNATTSFDVEQTLSIPTYVEPPLPVSY